MADSSRLIMLLALSMGLFYNNNNNAHILATIDQGTVQYEKKTQNRSKQFSLKLLLEG